MFILFVIIGLVVLTFLYIRYKSFKINNHLL